MNDSSKSKVCITGIGVTASIGQGKLQFEEALLRGEHRFGVMQRPGRQYPSSTTSINGSTQHSSSFLGAEIPELAPLAHIPRGKLRTASFSSRVAVNTLDEAWEEAQLCDVDPKRIGLIVGGSNFQQRELIQTYASYQDRLQFLRPMYGMTYLDSDLTALCTELYNIRGVAYSIGGASASGQIAIIQAAELVRSGQVDVCIALGALMDLSYWECQGFRAIGAMGSDRYADDPASACRPFDIDRDGFIYGESCGAIVIEKSGRLENRKVTPYAYLAGWAIGMDANRYANPSFEGEVDVIRRALKQAKIDAKDVDYVNPHGTGSKIGDETELQAFRECGLVQAKLNATKSIIGHGLSAAGTVEVIATLLQMKRGQLHPTRNLDQSIDDTFNWVRHQSTGHVVNNALKLSMGFGGINSALCLQNL